LTDNRPLTERPAYEQGRRDVENGLGDFRRRSYFGDERRAYLLGRSHAISEKHRQERKTG
jgi:hypothetical protein